MWLLKLHISFSILTLLTFIGFRHIFKDVIRANGYEPNKKKKKLMGYLMFFVPIINVLFLLVEFMMIFIKKKDFDCACEQPKDK